MFLDARASITLYLLHAILKPTNKKRTKGSNKVTKYTIKDAQNSFMVLLPSSNDVESYLNDQIKLKLSEKKTTTTICNNNWGKFLFIKSIFHILG